MNQCPKCHESTHQRKCGKTEAGSQRYSCKHCKTKYNAHNTTVINWVKAFAAQLPDAPLPEELHTIELDELFTFIETPKNASTS